MATEYESSAPANENVEEMGVSAGDDENEFAPIKLTKEQEENLRTVSKEAIKLEGQFDVDAYNEKFEKSTKVKDEEEKDEATVQQENQEEDKNHRTDNHIRIANDRQIGLTNQFECFRIYRTQSFSFFITSIIQTSQNEILSRKHPQQRSHRIESLRQI